MRKSPKKPRKNAAGREEASSSARDSIDVLPFDVVRRPRSIRDAMKESPKKLRQNAAGRDEVSSSARDGINVLPFDVVRRPRSIRDAMKESPKKLRQNAAGRDEVSSSAQDGINMLPFDIVRWPQSSRGAMEELKIMDAAEALVLLQEPCGKGTSSDDEPGVDYPGFESAADNPNEVLQACLDKRISAAKCNSHPVAEMEERLSHSDAIDNSDVVIKFYAAMIVITLLFLKPERHSVSVDLNGGTEKSANESLLVETELTRNDDGQGLVDCHETSAVMELKRPKLDLKVSDKSENTASDDSEGGDASGKQTSLTEPMAREADQKPEQKLDALEEQAAKGTTSVDEPGTDKPGEESGADNIDEVLTSCSEKSSCSVECYGGGEGTSDVKEAAGASSAYPYVGTENSGNDAPVVQEEELSRKHISQSLADCPKKSAVIEVEQKKPKLDHQVLDNSVVRQEHRCPSSQKQFRGGDL
ncbi:uncharacterized protein LOC124652592 [Lolium rigidum]|uniref:uncharacterized protein LOC124652592 n=1 Tax=Lolium rigidum TaxID=89674 RepID=UPI001F5D655C|nr:uncharacterized protein LOC124652592 [Lolium rigidum]